MLLSHLSYGKHFADAMYTFNQTDKNIMTIECDTLSAPTLRRPTDTESSKICSSFPFLLAQQLPLKWSSILFLEAVQKVTGMLMNLIFPLSGQQLYNC